MTPDQDRRYADRIAKLDAITRHRNLDGKGERSLQQHVEELVALENSLKRCAPQPDPVREPTEAMLDAARDWSDHKYGKPIGNDAAIGCWQAMFDAQATTGPAERYWEERWRDEAADNERLRTALEPFADADKYCSLTFEDDYSPSWAEFFTIGNFRRARAALDAYHKLVKELECP